MLSRLCLCLEEIEGQGGMNDLSVWDRAKNGTVALGLLLQARGTLCADNAAAALCMQVIWPVSSVQGLIMAQQCGFIAAQYNCGRQQPLLPIKACQLQW